MSNRFLKKLLLRNFLSFGEDGCETELQQLNVLIGPNGSGKSNFIEALELLHATPTDFSELIRQGGTPSEWLWKGASLSQRAVIRTRLCAESSKELDYHISFVRANDRLEIVAEGLEDAGYEGLSDDKRLYYRFKDGHPEIAVHGLRLSSDGDFEDAFELRPLERSTVNPEQSMLSQRKDPIIYPELTKVADLFRRLQIFREWSFGRTSILRQPQSSSLPGDGLLPNPVNLGHVLNRLEQTDRWLKFEGYVRQFLPRFKRLSTNLNGGSVQIYLHEDGLKTPISATRLSDGTIRFLALLALLVQPNPGPLICVEEPELGMHPDALSIIAELLVDASARTQLVVTTHSDILVSALTEQAESVLVCEYLAKGTQIRRLESEKLRFWLQKYSLGEIWRIGKLGGNLW